MNCLARPDLVVEGLFRERLDAFAVRVDGSEGRVVLRRGPLVRDW